MTLPEGEGALLLRGEDERPWRLSWEVREGEEPAADRSRPLPPGTYAVVGYRLVDRSRKGEVWHLSATGKVDELEVVAGEDVRTRIDPTVRLKGRLGGGRVATTVQGRERAGLTIYKDGRRLPLGWRLVAGDEVVEEGPITYG